MFTGRAGAEAEAPILRPPDAKNWLNGKESDAGKDWRHEEKGTTEDEMVGWHRWLSGHGVHWVWANSNNGVWASSRSWWWTGRPGMLRIMGSKRVGHDWVTELNWTEVGLLGSTPLISGSYPFHDHWASAYYVGKKKNLPRLVFKKFVSNLWFWP